MSLSRRYSPEWSPGDNCFIGMDFSYVLPPGVGIAQGAIDFLTQGGDSPIPTPRMEIWTNTNPPVAAPEAWIVDPRYGVFAQTEPGWYWIKDETTGQAVWRQLAAGGQNVYGGRAIALGTAIRGRAVYTQLAGGQDGVDYQIRWIVTDMYGNRWTRTGLLLCAHTS